MMSSSDSLNLEQRHAVEDTEGPICIIAGPGTGKTKTLISRMLYLLDEKNIAPGKILAITFTKKAAKEIQERLSSSYTGTLPKITTFHGLGYDLLKASGEDIQIASDRIREEVAERVIKTVKNLEKMTIKDVLLLISNYKNNLQNTADEATMSALTLYDGILKEEAMIDYDDLLQRTYSLLKQNSTPHLFDYVMIDEFQDTNEIQYEMIKKLTGNNIFVIGDPLQSIYSFRGADDTIFQRFKDDFTITKEITLQTNYRSVSQVIAVSAALFSHIIPLTPATSEEGTVTMIRTLNEYTEATKIVDEISTIMGGMDLIQAGNRKRECVTSAHFSDFAVIYRTHKISRVLQQRFEESGIPYQVVGGNSPYESKEAAFIIECLEYIQSGSTDVLMDILGSSILQIDKKLRVAYKTGANMTGKNNLTKVLASLQELVTAAPSLRVSQLVDEIVTRFHIKEYMSKKSGHMNSLQQIYSNIIRFDGYADGLARSINYFRYLKEHEYYDNTADRVTLLTMHAAKGLEFSYVFICGLEENSIPFVRAGQKPEHIEEERRLLYVALTRAKHHIYLLEAKERNRTKTQMSRFKKEILIPLVTEVEDEAAVKLERKQELARLKKNQIALF
ncbi:MAG: hypothetical protein RI947_733 [Candidatus Parcubacteria bacterium]|jgi:superfamily I DNA/RNA helicase